ncbi:MAG TPA: GDP-mannose 4,6-dehydratase [Gaiellaceae bacterium]|nr:GDP-mannose 4,6-dehydratase [Gaiellaceae bacterium]
MRVLVTGISGFAGPWVARALRDAGHDVHGLVRGAGPWPRLAELGLPATALHRGDLADGIGGLVRALVPDAVVHLAGLSFVPTAERDPGAAYRTNLGGTLAVLGALRSEAPRARLLVVSSSDVYGAVEPADLPVSEDTPLRPVSIYGASKAAADLAAAQWARAYGLDVVRARPFNHTGPGQDAAYVCSGLARQVALVEAGRQPPVLRVGNVDPVRDFSDVRDVAAGYVVLLERGTRGAAYNLCSGEGVSIAEVVALLRTHARVPVRVHSDPALRRRLDVERVVGSHARAEADTGWRPRIALAHTLGDVLDDWRRRVAAEAPEK